MSRSLKLYSAVALPLLSLAFPGNGLAAEVPTEPNQQLLNRINALEAEVAQLRSQTNATLDSQAKSDAAALERDADYHSRALTAEGFTAGYSDNRFLIQSADGRYVLHPWLQLQVRDVSTYRDDAQHGGVDSDFQNGFELRRLKLGFDGNVISPDLTYLFQFAVDRKTGNFALEQAWGKYHIPNTPFAIKAGQFKEPLDHEQLLASRYLTAVDRTLSNDLFSNSEGFVQGVSFSYDNKGALRAEAAFTDGQRSGNTNFQDFPATTADWGAAARVEYKLFGNWKDYDRTLGAYDSTADLLVFGAGADYTEAGDTSTWTHIVDAQYGTTRGLGLYAAYTGRYANHAAIGSIGSNGGTTGTAPGTEAYDWSIRTQASYVINEHWEPYVQYEFIHLDAANLPAGINNDIHAIRAGVNYYLFNTQARVTLDLSYYPNGSPLSDDGIGLLSSGAASKTSGISSGGGNEFVLRAQFQLAL